MSTHLLYFYLTFFFLSFGKSQMFPSFKFVFWFVFIFRYFFLFFRFVSGLPRFAMLTELGPAVTGTKKVPNLSANSRDPADRMFPIPDLVNDLNFVMTLHCFWVINISLKASQKMGFLLTDMIKWILFVTSSSSSNYVWQIRIISENWNSMDFSKEI